MIVEQKTYNQLSQSAVYREDDVAVSTTVRGGSYGGGSETLVVKMVLASIAPNAERTDGSISPTIMHRAGTGGGQLPILIMREEKDELPNSDRNS